MNMYSKRGAMNMLYPQAKLRFLTFLDIFHIGAVLLGRLARTTGKKWIQPKRSLMNAMYGKRGMMDMYQKRGLMGMYAKRDASDYIYFK